MAPAAATAAVAAPPPVLRVMPLGDSITYGVGSSTGAGYRLPLRNLAAAQSRYRIDFVGSQTSGAAAIPDPDNEGHSGFLIDDIRNGVDGWLAAARPDVVLLHIGINDLDRSPDPTHAPDRLHTLVDQIFADKPGVTVILQGLIPITQGLQSDPVTYNNAARALATSEQQAGHHLRYVDPAAFTSADMADRLHPNDSGHAKLGQVFFAALDQAFTDGWATSVRSKGAANEVAESGRVRWADFDGDGRADYVVINANGSVSVWLNHTGSWQALGQVATGLTTNAGLVRFADFDGDGRADYLLFNPNGSVRVFLNRGGDGHGGWLDLGQVATGLTSDATSVRFADFDGDGRADYILFNSNGSIRTFLNRGGDGHGGWVDLGQVAAGLTSDSSRVRLADLDGDGWADYVLMNQNGSFSVWLNRGGDGHGGWVAVGQVATGVTTDASQVQFADIDADAHADCLRTNANGSVNGWLWNGGDGHGGWIDEGQITPGF
ncbi:hypothetical protein GCM10009765_57970 [Fodinicola feengrottensis]|uniref:SGNH hydrolase-type esterase domain-containing protein n=2 Tax=Fodinicola feengrottensis TaxID=435914 RepID=A0ABN2I9C0_9ACTN